MKILLFLSFNLCWSLFCKSQTNIYHPFVHEGAQWTEYTITYTGEPPFSPWDSTLYNYFYYQSSGDTIIEGKEYIKLYAPYYDYTTFIREDTTFRRLYWRSILGIDTLMYDFSLNVGDSANEMAFFSYYPDAYVSALDSILIGDNYRKKWEIGFFDGIQDTTINMIEGIGTTVALLYYPGFQLIKVNQKEIMACYRENGEVLYSNLPVFGNCDSSFYSFAADNIRDLYFSQIVSIFPNPVLDRSQIDFDYLLENKELLIQIINSNGEIFKTIKRNPSEKIYLNANDYISGLYHLIVYDNDAIIGTLNFVTF